MSSNVDAVDSFETFLKNIKTSPNLNTLTTRISNQLLDVFWVEMATVYMVDPAGKLLVSWLLLPGETLRKICTPITKSSISGCVAATGKKTMIRDVYDVMELASIDPELKFDSSWDRKTGNRTRQILTVPICYGENVLGVLQLINKRHNGNFIDSDERNSELLASLLGQILEKIRKSKPEKKPGKFDKLIEGGVLSAGDLKNAVLLAKQEKSDVESILLEKFAISKDQLGICLANFYHTNFVDLTLDKYDPSGFLKGMNIDYFLKTRLVPLSIEENKVVLASDNPYDQSRLPDVMKAFGASQAEVFFAFGFDMEFYVERLSQLCLERERARVREKIMAKVPGDEQPKVEAKLTSDSKPIVKLVAKIIDEAYKSKASDIHIEPYGLENEAEVRFRVNGVCKNMFTIPKEHIRLLIERFKMLAALDVVQRAKPQNGKIQSRTSEGKDIELRVTTLPTTDDNEDMVLRVSVAGQPVPLMKIMPESIFTPFAKCIQKPFGMILVVGPANSGLSATVHLALNYINTPEKKICTVEDPIGIIQHRIRQVQVDSKIGLTFASAMRSFLLADPDVIMVGEMGDQEIIKMGIEASRTGKLVFSTMHTDSVAETISRFFDVGIDSFVLADSLKAILAQRLLHTLCPKCKEAYMPEKADFDYLMQTYGIFFFDHLQTMYSERLKFYRPRGCDECEGTGYKGKIGVYELFIANDSVRRQIIERAPVDIIIQEAINDGMITLIQEGIRLIFEGKTDQNQVMNACAL